MLLVSLFVLYAEKDHTEVGHVFGGPEEVDGVKISTEVLFHSLLFHWFVKNWLEIYRLISIHNVDILILWIEVEWHFDTALRDLDKVSCTLLR